MKTLRDWVAVLAGSYSLFTFNAYNMVHGIFYLEYLDIFNKGPFLTSWTISISALTCMMSGPLAGYLSDWFSNHAYMIFSSLLLTTFYIVIAFAPNIEVVLVVYGVLKGVSGAFGFVAPNIFVNRTFPEQRQRANAVLYLGSSLLVVVYPIITQSLLEAYSFRGSLFIHAGFALQTCICGMIIWRYEQYDSRSPAQKLQTDSFPNARLQITDSAQNSSAQTMLHLARLPSTTGKTQSTSSLPKNGYTCKLDHEINNTEHALMSEYEEELYNIEDSSQHKAQLEENKAINESGCQTWLEQKDGSKKKNKKVPRILNVLGALCNKKHVSLTLWFVGYKIAFLSVIQFLPAYSEEIGMSVREMSTLLTACTAFETVTRLLLAVFGDAKWMKKTVLITLTGFIIGTMSLLVPLVGRSWMVYVFVVFLGFLSDALTLFYGSLAAESVGIEYLGPALGMSPLTFGIASMSASPICGFLRETTGTYGNTMIFAGAAWITAAFVFGFLGGRLSLRGLRRSFTNAANCFCFFIQRYSSRPTS